MSEEEIFHSKLTVVNADENSEVNSYSSNKLSYESFENSLGSSLSNDYFVLDKEICQTTSSGDLSSGTLKSIKSSHRDEASDTTSNESSSDSTNGIKRISNERIVNSNNNRINDKK